eukprot:gb/GECG01016400.1/.p1 GENE.gb/GECG01016400.1/~~gb/GECG01016400.1/.p1  ORF type:complete len:116 (+),score=25.53 gb/GECG01016400.1/:1-348(+)
MAQAAAAGGDSPQKEESGEEWKSLLGARVRWPPDMPDDILESAIEISKKHVNPVEDWQQQGDEAVTAIKKEMDENWEAYWHVIAGHGFGSEVTHQSRRFVFFYLGDLALLIYKSG